MLERPTVIRSLWLWAIDSNLTSCPQGEGEGLEIQFYLMVSDLINHAYVMKPQ